MDQHFSINKIYPQKMKFSPAFASRISKPAIKTISETTLKTYSTAIAAMGMAGIALGQKEDEIPSQITKAEFIEILKSKKVPKNNLDKIATPCINEDGFVEIETLQKILNIIDFENKPNWYLISTDLDFCSQNGKISQKALDYYIEYLQLGAPLAGIGGILLESCLDSNNTFSEECLNTAKKLLKANIPADSVEQLLMLSKDSDDCVKEGFFTQLLELVQTLTEKKAISECYNLAKFAKSDDAEQSVKILRIINKFVKADTVVNPHNVAAYLQYFTGNEEFLEEILDYLLKTKTPMFQQIFTFYNKQESHLQMYSTLMQRETPFLFISDIEDSLPVHANLNKPILSFNNFIKNRPDFPPELLSRLLETTLKEYSSDDNNEIQDYAGEAYRKICEKHNITEDDIKTLADLRNRVLEKPELYVNGLYNNEYYTRKDIYMFFTEQYYPLADCIKIFDKETIDVLLRHRLGGVEEYTGTLTLINPEKKALLKEMVQCCNIDGTPFTPTQKLEFIDLLYAYETSSMPVTRIKEMTKEKRLDLDALEFDLFKNILSSYGITEKDLETVPKEKLQAWNLKYIHFLVQELENPSEYNFRDVITASLFSEFNKYIHDLNNDYGAANRRTSIKFMKLELGYEKWVQPNKDLEVQFKTVDSNIKQLELMAKQTEEDIATLLNTPVIKHLFTKRFPQNMQKGEFNILPETYSSKTKFEDFLKNLNHQLEDVWTRAESNRGKNPKASATLMVKDHIEERLYALSKLKDYKNNKALDWTIKMWDRIPQKDLFQGNYSTCCIGIGKSNGEFMPTYLMNTVFNMIELVDNNSGKTVGNALCYFVKDKQNKPAFVIDNIEISNATILSNENSMKLRELIVEYASKLTKDISGQENIPIYLSTNYNDIYCEDLPKKQIKMSLLGDTESFTTYLDMFHDGNAHPVSKDEYTRYNNAYILK